MAHLRLGYKKTVVSVLDAHAVSLPSLPTLVSLLPLALGEASCQVLSTQAAYGEAQSGSRQ